MPTAADTEMTSRSSQRLLQWQISTPGVARRPAAVAARRRSPRRRRRRSSGRTDALKTDGLKPRAVACYQPYVTGRLHITYRSVTLSSRRAMPNDRPACVAAPARAADRIRASARELFYREGSRAVGRRGDRQPRRRHQARPVPRLPLQGRPRRRPISRITTASSGRASRTPAASATRTRARRCWPLSRSWRAARCRTAIAAAGSVTPPSNIPATQPSGSRVAEDAQEGAAAALARTRH